MMMIPMCCSKVVSKFMSKSKESCASVFPTSWHCCSVTDSKRKSETNHLQQQGELIPDSINITVTNSTYVKIGNEKNGSISGLPQSYRIPLKKSKSQNRLQSFPFYSDLHLHPEEGVEQCSRICDIGHCCLLNALPRHLQQRQLTWVVPVQQEHCQPWWAVHCWCSPGWRCPARGRCKSQCQTWGWRRRRCSRTW